MTRLMTCHDYTARYDKATWSLEQLLDQGGYRLCAINVIFAQIGLAFAYTRTVANTLHQIWGLPMNWLFLGLGILLCLQSLGPESSSTRSEILCECWWIWWMTFFVREMQWFRIGHIMALGSIGYLQHVSAMVSECWKLQGWATPNSMSPLLLLSSFCQEHDWKDERRGMAFHCGITGVPVYCSVPSAVWHWRDSSRCDFIDLSAVPLQSFHLASIFSLLRRSIIHTYMLHIHTIFDIHILEMHAVCLYVQDVHCKIPGNLLLQKPGGNMQLHLSGCQAFHVDAVDVTL